MFRFVIPIAWPRLISMLRSAAWATLMTMHWLKPSMICIKPSDSQAILEESWGHRASYVDLGRWFNRRRLLEPIGNIPYAEAEIDYYLQLSESAMAAWLTANDLRNFRGGSQRL